MILWGPPGVGKTTLARLMADAFNAEFIALSAVLSGVKDIRDAVARAEAIARAIGPRTRSCSSTRCTASTRRSRMRSCRSSSRASLTFIGATTENPSFEVNGALLSRAAVYVLEPLVGGRAGQSARSRARRRRAGPRDRAAGARRADRVCRRRRPPPHQSRRISGHRCRRGPHDAGRPRVRRGDHRAQPAPLRQGRRGVLRPDLRAAQVGARLESRCGALLDVPDARRRRRPAVRRAPADPDGDRGYRARRSARAALDDRSRRNLRAARHRRKASSRSPRRALSRVAPKSNAALHGVRRGARVHRGRRLAAGAAAAAQRADAS